MKPTKPPTTISSPAVDQRNLRASQPPDTTVAPSTETTQLLALADRVTWCLGGNKVGQAFKPIQHKYLSYMLHCIFEGKGLQSPPQVRPTEHPLEPTGYQLICIVVNLSPSTTKDIISYVARGSPVIRCMLTKRRLRVLPQSGR